MVLLTYTEVLHCLAYPLIFPLALLNTHNSPVSPQAETLKGCRTLASSLVLIPQLLAPFPVLIPQLLVPFPVLVPQLIPSFPVLVPQPLYSVKLSSTFIVVVVLK